MGDQTVLYGVADGVATLTLNRPDKLNAFGGGMREALSAAIDRADGDDAVRALIITGAGRAFCSGADLGERVSLAELREFTYWCSKYRVQNGEPERVACDTRKALALLSQMALRRGSPAARFTSEHARGPIIDEAGADASEDSGRPALPPRPGGNGRRAPQPNRRRGSEPVRPPR